MHIRTDASSRTAGVNSRQRTSTQRCANGLVFKHRIAFLLALLFVAFSAQSARADDTIRVLLSSAPGAPSPAQVMQWVNTFPRVDAPPLAAFTVRAPLVDYWLIPDRASGDFLTWLNANPYSVRKKLEAR